MGRITQLDKSVYELIAAGEVIERPSSVIKELAENSIDSGASVISVEIKRGGIMYMRVTDNGCGISYEDMPLAFLRHATSKVSSADDLESINTLGFRGEALASVCAVSRVEVISKRQEDKLGTSYKLEGNQTLEYDKTGCADGTTIIIRDLFFNTPARLKFLKKDVTEGNYCASVIEKLALSHPNISFRFIRDGKQTLFTSGDGEYYSAVYSVFGKQFAAGMIPVDNVYRNIGVTGYVSSPLFTKSNRSTQNFFVNGRSVKSPLCCAAIEEAFRNNIMVGKFPACVLCINLDPALLDANISPAKTEVRFSDEKSVFNAIYCAVKNALMGYDESREISLGAPVGSVSSDCDCAKEPTLSPSQTEAAPIAETVSQPKTVSVTKTAPNSSLTFPIPTGGGAYSGSEKKSASESFYRNSVPYKLTDTVQDAEQQTLSEVKPPLLRTEHDLNEAPSDLRRSLGEFKYLSQSSFEKTENTGSDAEETPPEETSDIRVIGELFKTYILCESGGSLILIDKHAAHERVNFERFKKNMNIHSQLLIEPKEVLLTPEEFEAVSSFKDRLEDVGILLEFNDGRVIVKGLPQSLEDSDPEDLLQSISEVLARGDGNAEGMLFDDVLHTMACKASIRANEDQDISELAYLANIVMKDNNIRYCPHGRPVITQISKKQIEKYFGRIV